MEAGRNQPGPGSDHGRTASGWRRGQVPSPRRRYGVVFVVTILALLGAVILLAAVIGVAKAAQVRELTRFSASAAAQGAAGWTARTFNLLAMNNRAITDMVARIAVADSLPLAQPAARADLEAMATSIRSRLEQGLPESWSVGTQRMTRHRRGDDPRQRVAFLLERLDSHLDRLNKPAEPLPPITERIQFPHGSMWQAVWMLEDLSAAAVDNIIIQAWLGGLRNSAAVGRWDDVAPQLAMAPMQPPLRRCDPQVFAAAVLDGVPLPPPDRSLPQSRDVLMGLATEPEVAPASGGSLALLPKDPAAGKVPLGRPVPARPTVAAPAQPAVLAEPPIPATLPGALDRVIATLTWIDDEFPAINRGRQRMRDLARVKLAALWPQLINPVPQFIQPQWITDPAAMRQAMDKQPDSIRQSLWLVLEIRSRYPAGDEKFMSPGSWRPIVDGPEPSEGGLRLVMQPGWSPDLDPRRWEAQGWASAVMPGVWREQWTYPIRFEPTLGLQPLKVEPKQPVPMHTVYRIGDYVLLALDTGKPVEVVSPFKGVDPSALPRLWELKLPYVNPAAPAEDLATFRWYHLTTLIVAEHRARGWGLMPTSVNLRPAAAAAQACLHNPWTTSLWSQFWCSAMQSAAPQQWAARLGQPGDKLLETGSPAQDRQYWLQVLRHVQPMDEEELP